MRWCNTSNFNPITPDLLIAEATAAVRRKKKPAPAAAPELLSFAAAAFMNHRESFFTIMPGDEKISVRPPHCGVAYAFASREVKPVRTFWATLLRAFTARGIYLDTIHLGVWMRASRCEKWHAVFLFFLFT